MWIKSILLGYKIDLTQATFICTDVEPETNLFGYFFHIIRVIQDEPHQRLGNHVMNVLFVCLVRNLIYTHVTILMIKRIKAEIFM